MFYVREKKRKIEKLTRMNCIIYVQVIYTTYFLSLVEKKSSYLTKPYMYYKIKIKVNYWPWPSNNKRTIFVKVLTLLMKNTFVNVEVYASI